MKYATGMLAVCCAAGALAQTSESARVPEGIETVIVRAHPLAAEELAQSYRVLDGDELARNIDASIGAVVGRLPGVTTTFFGQAVGRPVIHGLGGPRVRVMEDHIPALDASVLSDDHAVTIEPLLADSIEILKGATSLIYGSGAIGGVVDVHTGRVPERLPDTAFSGQLEGRLDDVADQRTGAARFDGAAGGVAWHLDAFSRRLQDYDIPGFAESSALRALEDPDEQGGGGAADEVRGTLPNSDLDTTGGAFGVSWVDDRGFVGAAVSSYESDYGLPGSHAHPDAEDAGLVDSAIGLATTATGPDAVRLDLDQTRWDLAAGLDNPFPNFSELRVRFGTSDYEHSEREGPREIGSRYQVDAWEGRIEARHVPIRGWRGVIGLQFGGDDFTATGDEVFAPPSETVSGALFVVEERAFEAFTVQGGARIERVGIDPDERSSEGFDAYGVSVGALIPLTGGWELGLVADLADRAPVAAELYSDGPHLSTQSYEIGDPGLDNERAVNLAATIRFDTDRLEASATLYTTRFRDFIHQADSGTEAGGLPVRVWQQADADFGGIDLEVRYALVTDGPVTVDARAFHDFVKAELDVDGNDNLARLPADRAGAGLEFRWRWLTANVDYLRAMEQDDTATFELPTPAYDDLRLQLSGRFELRRSELTLFVQGRNLTDDDQRNHVSFLKDHAPLPGRSVLGGMRLSF